MPISLLHLSPGSSTWRLLPQDTWIRTSPILINRKLCLTRRYRRQQAHLYNDVGAWVRSLLIGCLISAIRSRSKILSYRTDSFSKCRDRPGWLGSGWIGQRKVACQPDSPKPSQFKRVQCELVAHCPSGDKRHA